MANFTDVDRIQRMREWMDTIHSEVRDLLTDDTIFWSIQDIIRSNHDLATARNHFFQWMGESFTASASIAVRRQADNDRKAVSLRRLLEELRDYAHLITREYYLGVASDGTPESVELNQPALEQWFSSGGGHLDATKVGEDIVLLTDGCVKIQHYADRRIAHYDVRGIKPNMLPTFSDLDDALKTVEGLVQKYNLILNGVWLGHVRPTIAYEWTEIFREPWISAGSNEVT